MPIYEYVCPDCKTKFELMRPISKSSEPADIITAFHLLMHQQGSTNCSHDLVIPGNNNPGIKLLLKCPHYTTVKSDSTLEYYWRLNIFACANAADIVAD